jgi:dihydrodipicolinate synthase/N-acetylneuraminate lyase
MTPLTPRPVLHPSVPSVLHDDGSLDIDGQTALAAAIAASAAGLVVLDLVGGEAADLDDDERSAVLAAARRGSAGLPLVVGVGPTDAGTVQRAHRLAAGGADALLAAVPTVDAARLELLGEVAAVGLPLWLHHHPAATGARLTSGELLALARELDATAVVVEAPPSPDHVAALSDGAVRAFGGLAGLLLPEELEAGAAGTACGTAVPELLGEVVRTWPDAPGDALARFLELAGYLRLESGSSGLRVRKEAWRQRQVIASGRTRRGEPLASTTKRAVTRRLRGAGADVGDPYPGA